jgi:hypothetical protein
MATLGDVLAAIDRIERAGHAGEVTRHAWAEISMPMRSPQDYDRILDRLRAACPGLFPSPPAAPSASPPQGGAPEQQGDAARAMKKAEAALSQQQSATAEFDRQVIEALLHAHKTTEEGRRQLTELEAQIEGAARTWNLSTATGAREFQRFLIGKLRQIVAVVQDANDDDTSKQALAAAWAALYASQVGQDGAPPLGRDHAPGDGDTPHPEVLPDTEADPYLDAVPLDEPRGESMPQHSAASGPTMPAGFGGGTPGYGSMPVGGAPGEIPLAGLVQGLQRRPAPEQLADENPVSAGGASSDEPGEKEAGDDPAAAPEPGPTTVTLPDGETVTAATPQLAAVMQAAVSGTPIADAFRQQGIIIPPPGTAVTVPVDSSRVNPGDIGMFTDRHALALSNSKALLDGQIQHVADLRGPSFLGWQHPPTLGETTTPTQTPTPIRPSATVRA